MALLSCRRLRYEDTPETVAVLYHEDSWPEAGDEARSQLGDADALDSGPAESPVELWTDVSRKSAFSL